MIMQFEIFEKYFPQLTGNIFQSFSKARQGYPKGIYNKGRRVRIITTGSAAR
jgi:hypothetical protein